MKHFSIKFILFFLLSALFLTTLYGQNINVKGSWSVSSKNSDIQAGNDISSPLESEDDELEISINGNVNKSIWKINVSKSDVNWDNQIEIWIRRRGDGNGSGEVWGGTTYQKISTVEMTFLNGKKVVNKIPVQLQIRNLSVTVPAMSYTTNLVFTLYEI